ncbi:biotin-dependent carboxyltransferase family protein [Rhodopseudomonas sp. P2A-2r]|uniref:5-oxoprolinase subunit C family protein n=1 Tax=Rhodopseudomonas sp. P2A-2r TaxID=2991972 RepID=UPI00223447AE|nr:biotin-dependent carboxyltransferase family protein [Rhodopseudomonas sp. P2A-2r]UZE50970.1 biotin-dependent carboxyltransferase family protein [Rhodopseudomonas sp. P2A-2r]
MAIKVVHHGLSTTVQDLGRPGYFHLGIPLGGAMDRYAMRAANLLVGNDESAAGLEAVFVGPQLEFTADALVAVTGAAMPVKLDGAEQPGWTALKVKAGQTLTFDFLESGARICIAVSGGIDVPVQLGSRSTYPIGALGGYKGRPLQPGDELPVGDGSLSHEGRSVDKSLRRQPGTPAELRALPGLYWHRLTEASKETFFSDEWKVANEADRMGYRFKGGRKLDLVERGQPFGAGSDPSNIVDSCYPYGSIQVPGGTEPIILHRDAVSGGGYFMVGTIIAADMDLIGQLQPHTPTRFVKVNMDQALAARADEARRLERLRASLKS